MEKTQELDIKRYFQLVLKRRYLFAMIAAAIITAVVIISYYVQPVYEAKTTVSIEKSFLNDVLRNIGGTQSIDDRTSALSTIMKSRTLIFKVINELGVDQHKMTEAQVKREMSYPEFRLKWKETIGVLPWQHIIVFEKQPAADE